MQPNIDFVIQDLSEQISKLAVEKASYKALAMQREHVIRQQEKEIQELKGKEEVKDGVDS